MKALALIALSPAAALAQEAAPALDGRLGQLLGSLLLVLALVVGLAWLARRLNGGRLAAGRNLRLVGGLSLGSRERIMVVEVGEVQLVLGVAPGRVQTLHVLDKPLSEAPAPEGFAARLAQQMNPKERD